MDLSLRFFEELATLLLLAAGTSILMSRLRIPPVLGYLAVGILAGPGSLGLIREVEFIRVLGELGVVLLMFGLGLDFEINRVRRTATLSVVAGVASVLATFVAVNGFARLIGLGPLESLFLAAGLSICGTAVNLKILSDMGHLGEEHGSAITATIVVTDIAAVLLLTGLSGIALGGGLDLRSLALSLLRAGAFLVLAPALGFILVPRILNLVARETRSREALLVTTLSLCFLLAVISQRLGFSLALGAFVMGMVISRARVYHPIEEMVKPLEHIFATLFFLSVGLSIRIGAALPYWPAVLGLALLIAVTKVVSVSSVAYLSGRNGKIALAAGWGLVPIGEFAFVIVNEGVRFGAVGSDFLAVTVAVALTTTAVAVVGLRTLDMTVAGLTNWLPAGVLNLFTLVQLRTAGATVVPGLNEATAHLEGAAPGEGAEGEAAARPSLVEQERRHQRYRRKAWAEIVDIGFNSAVVVTLTLALVSLGELLQPHSPPWIDTRLAALLAAAVLSAPSVVFLFKSAADLAGILSERLAERFPRVEPRVTRGALLAAGTFLLFVFLQAAVLPVIVVELRDYSRLVLALAGVFTLALGFFAWRNLLRFQEGLTALVRTSFAAGGEKGAARASAGRDGASQKGAPYRTMIEQYVVGPGSPVEGKSIEESRLREESGVSILGIERRGEWIGNPGAEEIIQSGDELVVLGSEQQREAAERYLHQGAPEKASGEAQTG